MGSRLILTAWVLSVAILCGGCSRSESPVEDIPRTPEPVYSRVDPRVQVEVSFQNSGSKTMKIFAELARSPRERSAGLMFRRSLPADHGMLFLFEVLAPHSFYMKNTFVPLDIIFMDSRGPTATVVGVLEHMQALDETPRSLTDPSLSALEVNAGLARRLGIRKGSKVEIRPYVR